jgi:hypothetical protein
VSNGKIVTVAVLAVLMTSVAAATVGFTQTSGIPDSFAAGDTVEINATVKQDVDRSVPLLFHLNVTNDNYAVPTSVFAFNVTNGNGQQVGTCAIGKIFGRNLCGIQAAAVQQGTYDATFEVTAPVTLQPGDYNMEIDMMSVKGAIWLQELLAFWNNPEEIRWNETSTVSTDNVEVRLTPSEEAATKDVWVNLAKLNDREDVVPAHPDDKKLVRGAQVLVMEDIAERSGVNEINRTDIFGNSTSKKKPTGGSGIDISLVIDTSSSMGWGDYPMDDAKKGAKSFVDTIDTQRGDRVAIVNFDSNAFTAQPLTANKTAARSAIDDMYPSGGTDHNDAVYEGISSLEDGTSSKQVIVMLGDGCSPTTSEGPGEAARNAGIEIHTIMYGSGACPEDFEPLHEGDAECTANATENKDGDNCWYAETENVLEVFDTVQQQIDKTYLRDTFEDSLFGGDTGQVEANGTITVEMGSAAAGLDRNTMALYRYNGSVFNASTAHDWVKVKDWQGGNTITADVDRFSMFAVFADPQPPQPVTQTGTPTGGIFAKPNATDNETVNETETPEPPTGGTGTSGGDSDADDENETAPSGGNQDSQTPGQQDDSGGDDDSDTPTGLIGGASGTIVDLFNRFIETVIKALSSVVSWASP